MAERDTWRNWARNQRCTPAAWETPRSELEVVEAVRRARSAGQAVKVVGNGHSFTDVACTDGRLLSLDLLDRVLAVDNDAGTVTVEAGITIRQLNRELAERGLALTNLGDIDRQTISGAISTGTHGTGSRLGGLATFIRAMELVTADGDVVRCSPDEEPEVFHGARVGLGALGVVTKLTLACEPAFTLRHVERAAKLDEVVAEIDQLADGHDHFEFYWLPHTDTCSLLCNDRTDEAPRPKSAYKRWRAEVFFPNYFFGAVVAAGRLRPELVPRLAAIVGNSVGSTRLIDRSDRILISTRLLRFVEMEYAIPRGTRARGAAGRARPHRRRRPARELPGRGALHRTGRHPVEHRARPRDVLHRGAHGARHAARALLRRGRGDHGPLRGTSALGQAPRATRRDARAEVSGVGALRSPARAARSRRSLRQRLPRPGSRPDDAPAVAGWAPLGSRAMPYPKNLLNDRENLALDLRPHWWYFSKHILTGIPLLILWILQFRLDDGTGRDVARGTLGVVTIVWAIWLLLKFVSWTRTYFVVTDQRVVYRTGVLSRHGVEIPLDRVNNINFHQRMFDRVIGAGESRDPVGRRAGHDEVRQRPPSRRGPAGDLPPDGGRRHARRRSRRGRGRQGGGRCARQAGLGGGGGGQTVPEQIEALAKLRDQGHITPAEFEQKKAELLAKM